MKRISKIGNGFYQKGYGRGLNKKATIYLFDNGYLYARSKINWLLDFEPLTGDLQGYVRINAVINIRTGEITLFTQCYADDHTKFELPKHLN